MAPRIEASAVLAGPIVGAICLRRETGADPTWAGQAVYNAWARGLERSIHVPGRKDIANFAIDKETGAVLLNFTRLGNESSPLEYACISHPGLLS